MGHSGYAERPDYRVDILARRNRVTVQVDGEVLADSARCLLVDEQDHGLVFYFPPDDVRLELFEADDRKTFCPYKGTASYLRTTGTTPPVLAWTYRDPFPEVARLAGYLAFFQDAVEVRLGVAEPAVSGR